MLEEVDQTTKHGPYLFRTLFSQLRQLLLPNFKELKTRTVIQVFHFYEACPKTIITLFANFLHSHFKW